jgi:hypothetical protein
MATVPEVVSSGTGFNTQPGIDCATVGGDDLCLTAWFNGSQVEGRFRRNGTLEAIMPVSDGTPQGSVSNVNVTFYGPNFLITWERILTDEIAGQQLTPGGTLVGGNMTLNMCAFHEVAPNGFGGGAITCNRFDSQTGDPIGVVFTVPPLCPAAEEDFIRGDPNDDGEQDIADGVWVINELMQTTMV